MKSALQAVLLLSCLSIYPFPVMAQPGAPAGISADERARRLAAAVLTLDRQLPTDAAQIHTIAEEATKQWRNEAKSFKVPETQAAPPGTLLTGRARFVERDELLDLVDSLGDMSVRLTAAKSWMQMSVATEQIKVAGAKAEAKARNLAELRRAYADYQAQLQDRQNKLWELSALASGRARVVAVRSSTGSYERDATPAEARAYAANLFYQANSPINVEPPQKTRPVDIHPVTELIELRGAQEHLDALCGLVNCELKNLASLHDAALQKNLAHPNPDVRKHALAAAGWWNDISVRSVVMQALRSNDADERTAALAALPRLRLGKDGAKALADNPHDEVRMEAARLVSEWLDKPVDALQVLRSLVLDPETAVRGTAYNAVSRIDELSPPSKDAHPVTTVAAALKSTDPAVVVDACQWLQSYGNQSDLALVEVKEKRLAPLTRSRDPQIRAAAQAAMQGTRGIAFQ